MTLDYTVFATPRNKKARKKTIHDVNRMETVREDKPPRETLKSFTQAEETRLANEKAAKEAAEERRITAPLREELRKASERVAKYFRNTSLADLSSGINLEISPVDPIGSYVAAGGNRGNVVAAYRELKENLASHGCTLTADGWTRFGSYLTSLFLNRDVSISNVSNLTVALQRCVELNIFADGEITGYHQPTTRERVEPTPVQEVDPLAAIETLNLSTREGSSEAKRIATNDYFGRQAAQVTDQWQDWLLTTFNYVLTPAVRKAASRWWEENPTASMLSGRDWNRMRLNLIQQGVMPLECRTAEEIACDLVEQSDLSDVTVRQKISRLHHDMRSRY